LFIALGRFARIRVLGSHVVGLLLRGSGARGRLFSRTLALLGCGPGLYDFAPRASCWSSVALSLLAFTSALDCCRA